MTAVSPQALVPAPRRQANLMVTAMYTAGTWAWARLPSSELFDNRRSRRVFRTVNNFLRLGWFLGRPSLRHGLVQRHVMIDRLVEDAGVDGAGADPGVHHVLELAAGLSRRGAHFSSDPAVQYTEVDLDVVLARKRGFLERSDAGRAVLARPNLRLVEGDLRSFDLATVAAPATAPAVVVAEGLLMYLTREAQRDLFARIRAILPAGGLFVFDLVPPGEQPPPGPLDRAVGWILRRATRGDGFIADGRGRAQIVADLAAAGFEVTALDPAAAPARWRVPHLERRTQQVVFCATVPSGSRTFVQPDVVAASRSAGPGLALPASPRRAS